MYKTISRWIESRKLARAACRLSLAVSLLLALSASAAAQFHVAGNGPWVAAGSVVNGTEIQVNASGSVNVGAAGVFGPEGSTERPRLRSQFPADTPLYGLVLRLTASATNPDDELREDYSYTTNRSICFHSNGQLWLKVNDESPQDNTGEFLVRIASGSCGRTDPGGRASRVHVSDERRRDVDGAEIYVDGLQVGVTGRDGVLLVPELRSGSQIISRKMILENSTDRPNHASGSSRGWNYRVYLTNLVVNDNGSTTDFSVNDPTTVQELRLSEKNPLIGIHLTMSIEWDASSDEFRHIEGQIAAASQRLYNATDGQFFFEQVDLTDLSGDWVNADMRMFTNWSLRANANVGGLFSGSGWLNIQRLSWDYVYAHEFGHYGLDLYDEYSDTDADVRCTHNITDTGSRYRMWEPQAACMMWNNAPKFCSHQAANRHTSGLGRGDEDCWAHILATFADRSSPARWTLQSPDSRGSIPGTIPAIPVNNWSTRFTVTNHDSVALCTPRLFIITDPSGRRLSGISVFHRSVTGARILEGMSRTDDPATVEDETGQLLATGLHNGDAIVTDGGASLTITSCTPVSRNWSERPDSPDFADGSASIFHTASYQLGIPFVSALRGPLSTQWQPFDNVIVVKPNPFDLSLSIEPGYAASQLMVHVRASSELAKAPVIQFSSRGDMKSAELSLKFDEKSNSYFGVLPQLPPLGTATIEVTAIDKSGQTMTRILEFSVTTLRDKDSAEVFSANGQVSLKVSAGGLPAGSRVVIGPSDAPQPSLPDDLVVVSGPYRVASSAKNEMSQMGALRFQLPDQVRQTAPVQHDGLEGYDNKSFEIRRYNEAARTWESVGGMLLRDIAIVTLPTKKLGTYALVARRLGGHDGQRQENQQVESRKSEDAMVTEAELKADDDKLSGRCPLTVKFSGSIRSTGPGTVAYTFLRSDGATGPTFTLVFKNAGTQAVFTTWTLGDSSGLPSYSGWQAIRILSPNELESNHNTGSFAISCK